MSIGNIGYKGMKPGNCGVVYVPYIPVQLTPEQAEVERKRKVAGKTFARVSLEHSDPCVRRKEGEVLETREENGKKLYCLCIEKLNTCSKDGFMTLLGVVKSDETYSKEWVSEDLIDKVWSYDADGNERVVGQLFAEVSDKHSEARFCGQKSKVFETKAEDGKKKYLLRLNAYGSSSPNSKCWTAIKPKYVNT